jgi:hypothetical protein
VIMTRTVADCLAATEVVFCLDTNILIEFRSPADLPWKELAPNATSIRLIVPTKVGIEMDQHKFSSGRLRKRAADFAELARRIEDSGDRPVQLSRQDADIAVTIEFGPLYRTNDLDGEQFDLNDPDNRVVAEATIIARDIPELILLADDSLPIRLARHVGLLHVRPPGNWRRPADGDERDETIADLRRQLGPQPKLILAFPAAADDNRRYNLVSPPDLICQDCIDRIYRTALALDPQVPRSTLEARYPSARPMRMGPYEIPSITSVGSVSSGMLDRYEQEFDSYRRHLHIWASGLPKILSKPGVMRPIDIEIGNEGDRAADKVHLEATLSGPFHFLATDHFDVALADLLEVPDAPEPYLTPYFSNGPDLGTPRVDAFYPLDEPNDDDAEPSRRISWRCEELRQGARFTLPCIVVAEKAEAQGALVVTARGALQAKAVTLTAPLKVSALPHPGPFANYLLAHLALVPLHYRRALAAELSVTDRPCTCDDTQA